MSDSDIVQDFLAESRENLDRLDRELVGLEKHPHDRDALASVFRTIHTIKGTCGFLGFNKLEKVTHVGESLLARLRDGQLTLNPEHTTALLTWWMRSARCSRKFNRRGRMARSIIQSYGKP